MEHMILNDSKKIRDYKYPIQDIESLIGYYKYNMLRCFYENPFSFDEYNSLKLIDILYEIENSKLDDFAMLSILKHGLTDLGTYTKRGKFLLDEVYGIKSVNSPKIDEFCSRNNYNMCLKWLIQTGDEFFSDDLHSAVMDKPELLNIVFEKNPKNPDLCFRHAAKNIEYLNWIYLKYQISNSERKTTLAISIMDKNTNPEIIDFLLFITNFEKASDFISMIKQCAAVCSDESFKKLNEIMNLNEWTFSDEDKKAITLSIIRSRSGLDKIQYFYSLGFVNIYESSIFEEAFISDSKILEWLLLLDKKGKFGDPERLKTLEFSYDLFCLKLLSDKGYIFGNIVIRTMYFGNTAKKLQDASIDGNFEELKEYSLTNGNYDILTYCYPYINIAGILDIINCNDIQDKIKLFKSCRKFNEDFLEDLYKNFKDELDEDMINDLFDFCCSEIWYEGMKLITNNGTIINFKNKQENFLKCLCFSDLRILKLLYYLGDINIPETISKDIYVPYVKKWLKSKLN